jgi:hypothetical protein
MTSLAISVLLTLPDNQRPERQIQNMPGDTSGLSGHPPTVLTVTGDPWLFTAWMENDTLPFDVTLTETFTCDHALRHFLDKQQHVILVVVCAYVTVRSGHLSAPMGTESFIRGIIRAGYKGEILAISDDPGERTTLNQSGVTAFCTRQDSGAAIRRHLRQL